MTIHVDWGTKLILLGCTFFPLAASYAQVLDYQTRIILEEEQLVEEKSFLIQINNSETDYLSDIKIPYAKGDEVIILDAQIVDAQNNRVRVLKKKEITTRSAIDGSSFYTDNYIKYFSLKWNTFPYKIKYSYRIKFKRYLFLANWRPIVDSRIKTKKASLEVLIPDHLKTYIQASPEFKYKKIKQNNKVLHTWNLENGPVYLSEEFAPPLGEIIPRVIIIPEPFNYGLEGSFASWSSYGAWQEKMNEDAYKLPTEEKLKVRHLIADKESPYEKVKALYSYLQDNTRYIYVGLEVGGLKPYPASFVCEKKYGDCKALTVYMKALLQEAGIPSFYSKVFAGENPVRIDPTFPSQQFNHVILSIPLEGDTIWLENTAGYLPFNYLGSFTQDRWTLQVKGQDSKLIRTPKLDMEAVLNTSNYSFELDDFGNGKVQVAQILSGEDFEVVRQLFYQKEEDYLKEYLEERIALKRFELLDWKINYKRDQRTIGIEMNVKVERQMKDVGTTKAIKFISTVKETLEVPEKRNFDIRITLPQNRIDTFSYRLSNFDKYDVTLPKGIAIENEFGNYSFEAIEQNEVVLIVQRFQLYKGDYSKERYPELYQFYEDIKSAIKKNVLLLKIRT